MSRILRVTLIVLLTVVFLGLFLWKSNLRDVWRILLTTNVTWFAMGFLVNGSALIFRTFRWRILLRASNPPPFYPTFFANTMGYMLSTILPVRAGDVARPALLARRTDVRFSEALGTVLTERVLDLLSILCVFLFFCVYRWYQFDDPVVHGGAYVAGTMLAGLALTLATIGLYGLLAYTTLKRLPELGLRLALGATRGNICALILSQGARLLGLGLIIGLAGALALARVLGSFLFEVKPVDPVIYAAVSILLAAATILACWIPARRASRIDPIVTLRAE